MLNREALIKLFRAKPGQLKTIDLDGRYNSRIRGHLISRELFLNVSGESRKEAIEVTHKIAKEEIEKIRRIKNNREYKHGLAHAFWQQQIANTILSQGKL